MKHLLALTCLAIGGSAIAGGGELPSGHLVRWVPNYGSSIPLTAAIGGSASTVVTYNPRLLNSAPPILQVFSLLRQDYVAFLTSTTFRSEQQYSRAWGDYKLRNGAMQKSAPSTTIPELAVYDFPELQPAPERALSCLAYQALTATDRQLLSGALMHFLQVGKPLRVIPTGQMLTPDDLVYFNSTDCSGLAQKVREIE